MSARATATRRKIAIVAISSVAAIILLRGNTGESAMKTTLLLTLVLTSTILAAPPAQDSVQIILGPKAYRDGDVIEITDVTATSRNLEQGDSVIVRGRVRLDSRSSARLCLFLTQTQGDGSEETDPGQTKSVSKGIASFELKATIKHRGVLHLTLYDSTSGKPFGGTYFGTVDQMTRVANWNVDYYLSD
jgi:hypothetical protein